MPKIRPFAGPPASAMDTLWDAPPTVEEVPEDGSGNGARRDPIPHPFSLQKPWWYDGCRGWKHLFLPTEWGCWTYLILLGWDLMIWLIWIHVWELNPSFAVEHGFVSNAKLVVSPEVRESLLNSEQSEPWYFRVKRTVASNVSNITYISPFIRNGHAVPTSFGVEVSGDTGDPPWSNQGGLASASGATARHSGRRSRQRPLLLGVLIWTLSGNHGLNMFKWLNQWRWWD